jgi:hypothetical protein
MPSKRDRRRALLAGEPQAARALTERKLVRWGSPRRAADRCTMTDAPAQFPLCLDCSYNAGAHNDGIWCTHRFGIDPTLVDGTLTQVRGDQIERLERLEG